MSYKQCLANGLNEGLVTKEQYDEQLEFIGMQERFYKGQGINPTEASIKAAKEAYDKFKGDAQADWLGKRKGMEMFNVGDVNESGGVPFQPDYSTKSWTNLGSKIAKGWSAEGGLGITAKKTKAAETGDKFKGTKQFATV